MLAAALVHATWNAILRARGDRLASITVMSLTSGVVGAIGAIALPVPLRPSWPFIAASAMLQVIYCLALVRAYRDGLLAEAYPVARGASPLLVTIGALILAHERLSLASLAGVALVAAGIFGIALGGRRIAPRSIVAALIAGVMIASYTLCDGLGGRRSGDALAYAAWLFALQGAAMVIAFLAVRRAWPRLAFDADTGQSLLAGVLSLIAYGVVIWALSLAPMGQVSALRETGILFAMIIGVAFLNERPRPVQAFSGLAIALGAALLSGV